MGILLYIATGREKPADTARRLGPTGAWADVRMLERAQTPSKQRPQALDRERKPRAENGSWQMCFPALRVTVDMLNTAISDAFL